jgi:mRNA interferase MazF
VAVYSRGDVVLVTLVFADESGQKRRPALVISSAAYNRARQEVVVAGITSNLRRRLFGENPIADWKAAGLLYPSVVTGIFRTIKRTMIERKLGSMMKADLEAVERERRRCLDL